VAWNALCRRNKTHIPAYKYINAYKRLLYTKAPCSCTADGSIATFNDKRVSKCEIPFCALICHTTLGKEITTSTAKTCGPGWAG